MRSSIGGWVENSWPIPPAIPKAATLLGSSPGVMPPQTRERVDHGLALAHQLRSTGVSAEFALAAEPGDHHGGGKAQNDVQGNGGDVVADSRAAALLVVFAQKAVHRITDHAAQENHKGIHHALNQRHGYHIAVGNVRDLMPEHRLHFVAGHALQQTGGYGHQGGVAESAPCKGIGLAFKNTDLRHANTRLLRKPLNRLHNPGLVGVLRLLNQPHAGTPFRQGLADQK